MSEQPLEENGPALPANDGVPPEEPNREGPVDGVQQVERIAPTCCRFNLSGKDYFLAIEYMLEIADLPDITSVPLAPAYLRGLVNIRGDAIPVIDLSRFEGGSPSRAREHRLIIADAGGERLAFLAEGIPSLSREMEGAEVDVVHFVRSYKIGVN